MEYVKGKPYFCEGGQIKQYPYLKENKECEVLIIGGGIDGAIANFYLSQNHNVILVDKGRLGYTCTSCATALLEYQLDDFAKDLLPYMTEEETVMAYNLGLKSIQKIKNFIKQYGNHCNFNLRPTFLFTNSVFSVKKIEEEYAFRRKNSFQCELYTKDNNPFKFDIKSGIYCENGGCEFNPYLFTKQLVENSKNQDAIFENTDIDELIKIENGYLAKTNYGEVIRCKKVLIATGFNWEILNNDDLCERFISYSIVTSPIDNFSWHNLAMVHDASSPYHYMRLLPDNRIIYGGEDTKFNGKPIKDKLANKKYDQLSKDLFKMFPDIQDKVAIDYKFCGSFGTTKNNMGLIGESTIDDDILMFISCGANGIINAIAGVEIIEDILKGKENKLMKLFSPKRKNI